MKVFGIILAGIVLLVLLLSCWCSRYLARGRARAIICGGLVLFDVGTAGFLIGNDRLVQRTAGTISAAAAGDIILFMAQLIACVLILLAVLGRWGWRRMMRVPVDASRRRLLKQAAVWPAMATGLSLYGGLYERRHTVERSYTIPLGGNGAVRGWRLAQISDIHLGPFFSVEELQALLEQAAAGEPDMLVITGDLFDDVAQNPAAAELLDCYVDRFPDGIWYCLGNHEYYRGSAQIRRLLAQTRVHALYNGAEQVQGREFWVAGVEYAFANGKEAFRQERHEFLNRALAAVPDPKRTLLLAHHPEFIDDAAEAGIPLTLTGHTHGSQFGLLGVPLFPVFKYTRGLVHIGASYGYVHSGNGSWFPMRIGCPPEIAYFTFG